LTLSSSAASAADCPTRTVHGRALPVSSDQSPMPNIWCDYAPWRANENSCVARQNAPAGPAITHSRRHQPGRVLRPGAFTMNENRRWTSAEKATLFAAVEQFRATGVQLDWHAIAATVPGRSAKAAQTIYYQLFAAHTLVRIPAPAAPISRPSSVFRRPCLRCRCLFDALDRKRNWICSTCNERIAALGSIAV
jgi:hypothetical protein